MHFETKYRFFFDLFMRGYVSPFYHGTVRNKLTDELIFSTTEEPCTFENLKIATVWDVPEYLQIEQKKMNPKVQVLKIRQYEGFLIHLSNFDNADDFLNHQLSSSSRKKLRSKKRKLEAENEIRYAFYHGAIEKEEYERLFTKFYTFLESRFQEKKAVNRNLVEWAYYRELVYPMILEKRASLFVIYADDCPITIGLQFHLSDTVFSYIQSYDILYSAYNMGDINMMKRLEWCFEQGFKVLDLSMGETDYKIKWCNHRYNLFFHVFYNKKSIRAILKCKKLIATLKFKQYLRDKDILGKLVRYDKIKYRIKHFIS